MPLGKYIVAEWVGSCIVEWSSWIHVVTATVNGMTLWRNTQEKGKIQRNGKEEKTGRQVCNRFAPEVHVWIILIHTSHPVQNVMPNQVPSTLSLGSHMAEFILGEVPRPLFWTLWRGNQESVSANIYCMLEELVAGVTGLDCTLQVKLKLTKNALYICRGGLTVNDIEPTSHIRNVSMYYSRKVKRGGNGLLGTTLEKSLNPKRVLLWWQLSVTKSTVWDAMSGNDLANIIRTTCTLWQGLLWDFYDFFLQITILLQDILQPGHYPHGSPCQAD